MNVSAPARSTTGTVILAGLIAGTIDIGAASLIGRLAPAVILRAIASGLLGARSFDGGIATALLGLLLQWAMAILIAVIYLAVTSPLPALRRRWPITGVIAGIVIFLVMNYVVVPLSAAPFRPPMTLRGLLTAFTPHQFFANLLAMIVFGLLISYFLRGVAPRSSLRIRLAHPD
jgi:hypothetical protein